MAKFAFYPVHAAYKLQHDKPVVELYGRTQEKKQLCVAVEGFEPYFYILPKAKNWDKLIEELKKLKVEGRDRTITIARVEKVERKIGIEKQLVLKVFTAIPADVKHLRDELKEHKQIEEIFDADIPFVRRFLIDANITPLTRVDVDGEKAESLYKVPVVKTTVEKITPQDSEIYKQLKVLALDLETYNPLGEAIVPEKFPIVMAAFAGEKFHRVITWKRFKTKDKSIEFVENETALIHRMVKIIEEQAPDVLLGYFSDGFDLPYLKTRAEHLGIELNLGLDRSGIRLRHARETVCRLTGLVHLDIFKFIRKTMFSVLKTSEYTLDAVSKELLGEGKGKVDLGQLAEIWDKHPEKLEPFCQYNLKDAELTYLLYKNLFDNLLELVKVVGQSITEVSRMAYSQLVEWYLLRQAFLDERVVPMAPHGDDIGARRGQTFQGAFVVKPEPGLHKDIIVLDFRSLYPSIISAHNISPETLRCGCCKSAVVPGDKTTWFCQKQKGFISGVIENLITRRIRVKEIMGKATKSEKRILHARQYALKTVANSMYGYLGFAAARWYSLEAAKSITAYGRYYINDVIKRAEKAGFQVLYGDTDSVFLSLLGRSRKEAEGFIKKVNSKLPGLMELEFEGFYPRGIFVSVKDAEQGGGAKKKYALLGEDGEIMIKGFESVKRNYAKIAKEVQEKVLDFVLRDEDVEKAFDYIRKTIKDVREHKIPIDKLILMTRLQKPLNKYQSIGPHVAAAMRLADAGYPVRAGMMIKYVITEGDGKISARARLPEEIEQKDYDTEYYINHQIIPVVEKIFEVLGYTKEQLIEGQLQSKLGSYL